MALRFKFGWPATDEFDRETCFVERARQLMATCDDHQVVVDLHEIEMISSAQLNGLIALHTELRNQSRTLRLINLPEHLVEVFRVTRLDRLFVIDGEQAASTPATGNTNLPK